MSEILWFCFELSASTFESFIIIDFLTKFFTPKYSGKKKVIGYLSFIAILVLEITIVNTIFTYDGFLAFIYILISILYCIVFLKGNKPYKFTIPIVLVLLIFLINLGMGSLIGFIVDKNMTYLVYELSVYRMIVIIITKILFFYCVRIILKLKEKRFMNLGIKEWLLMVIIPAISIVSIVTFFELSVRFHTMGANQLLILIPIICIIAINIIINYIFSKLDLEYKAQKELIILSQQQDSYIQEIVTIKNNNEELKSIRHEMKNFNTGILALLSENKVQESIKYIEANTEKIISTSQYFSTSNIGLDSLINSKLNQLSKLGVQIRCESNFDIGNIDEMDLIIMFGNLLNNIIEYYQNTIALEEKYVEVKVYNYKGFLVVRLGNKIKFSVLNNNEKLLTTKNDKNMHGFGIKNISRIILKYDGSINFHESNNMFCCNIMLSK